MACSNSLCAGLRLPLPLAQRHCGGDGQPGCGRKCVGSKINSGQTGSIKKAWAEQLCAACSAGCWPSACKAGSKGSPCSAPSACWTMCGTPPVVPNILRGLAQRPERDGQASRNQGRRPDGRPTRRPRGIPCEQAPTRFTLICGLQHPAQLSTLQTLQRSTALRSAYRTRPSAHFHVATIKTSQWPVLQASNADMPCLPLARRTSNRGRCKFSHIANCVAVATPALALAFRPCAMPVWKGAGRSWRSPLCMSAIWCLASTGRPT